jgi:hypothetical protein
VVEG